MEDILNGLKKKSESMNNRKLVIAETGKEVKFGDLVSYFKEKKTNFGTIRISECYTLTVHNVDILLERGILKLVDAEKKKSTCPNNNIGFYLHLLAKKLKCKPEELSAWLEKVNEEYPKVVLDLFLNIISDKLYDDNPKDFDNAETYFGIRAKDGKVGKVVTISDYIPTFKSKEDAEIARNILKEQLDFMYGEQENN